MHVDEFTFDKEYNPCTPPPSLSATAAGLTTVGDSYHRRLPPEIPRRM
jgi:hypothetical protein